MCLINKKRFIGQTIRVFPGTSYKSCFFLRCKIIMHHTNPEYVITVGRDGYFIGGTYFKDSEITTFNGVPRACGILILRPAGDGQRLRIQGGLAWA